MSETSTTLERRPEELEKAVQEIIKKVKGMTPEEHVAKFKRIGFLTKDGKVAPEFRGVNQLLRSSAG